MKQRKNLLSAALLSLVAASASALAADVTKSIEDALNFGSEGKNGAVKIDLNYRYENVDQDISTQKIANANTIRTRLGLISPKFHGLQGYVEYEGTHALQSDYNNGRNNKPEYSTVADPAYNELNQLWISYSGVPDTLIKGGRQRIKLDDERFIGNVGWRQLETTFDSVLITNQSIANLTANVGYIGNVQTFISTTENINAPIINLNYKVGEYGNLVGYGYWLGYTEQENYNKSNQTYGIRLNGSPKVNDIITAHYTAEWSLQKDYLHSPADYEVDRFNIMGGLTAHKVTLQGAMEQLNGVGANQRFIVPLGTNHAFQGWADLFLVTPDNGIRDVFGTMSTKLDNDSVILSGIYHDFTDDTGRIHYGKEYDFQAIKKFGKHYSLLGKYAYYDADQLFTNTQKFMLQGNVNF